LFKEKWNNGRFWWGFREVLWGLGVSGEDYIRKDEKIKVGITLIEIHPTE
jgi:hypothetical protein